MKPIYYFTTIFFFSLIFLSCNDTANKASEPVRSKAAELEGKAYKFNQLASGYMDGDNNGLAAELVSATDVNGNSSSPNQNRTDYDRKLVRKADLKFKTDSIEKTHQVLADAAKNLGGFISNENQVNQTYRNSSTMVIRLPSNRFDQLIAICDSHGNGKYDRRNIFANDVTEEFLDITARVKTKKELESRYHELLKQAKDVEEVIKVEKEISKLRTAIESSEGRLKYLADRVSLSTVEIEYYRDIEQVQLIAEKPNRFSRAFFSGWNGLVAFMLGLVNIWPLLLLLLGTAIFGYRRLKSVRKINTKA